MGSLSVEPDAGQEEQFDLVIVGAGINGLYAARALLAIQPSINLVVVDSLSSVGGVWSRERIYPGLNVQTTPEYFELPELRYKDVTPPLEHNSKGFMTGPSWSRYFQAWSEKVGLTKHVRLNTTVRQIARHADGKRWQCYLADSGKILTSDKLIVANGIASLPKYPDLDCSKFSPPVMHHRYFGERRADWDKEEVKHVTVYGAGKGSMDNIVQLIKSGKKVKWVIRKGGRGPPWIMDPNLPNGGRAEALGFSRFLALIMPSLYQDEGFSGLHYFFKQNFFGRNFSKFFMNSSRSVAMSQLKPLNENLRRALPEMGPFWMYHVIGIDNYDIKVYDFIRNGDIEVARDDIVSLQGDTVTLESGESFQTDAVVFATGWKASISLFSDNMELEMQMGLPSTSYTDEYTQKWKALEEEADKRVYLENPILKDAPAPPRIPPQESGPFRLYHYTVPTNFADGSIAFLGVSPSPGTCHYAIVMGLWTAAYLTGKLELPSKEELEKVTAFELRFTQIRHVGLSNEFPLITFDWMAIVAEFLKELGINPYMKGGYFREIFWSYKADDYADLFDKWIAKHGIVEPK
ncbi:hypothetical protein DRE_07285 [Drechslerella stenobrocha 248]|uniref:FAD/NAD(P)-binding domain-containing protein n=1 Tax=Drechslerella stenobrocha 248 TaxID=1043628 RepID=W7HIU3_9PEZI|nr:hypothetical protein DRE_07285 [Drechslerella stenobrocha 248]